MVVVRNTSLRPVKITELGKVLPVSDNNYIIPEYIYDKYKNRLSLINMLLDKKEVNNIFTKKSKQTNNIDIKSELDEELINIAGVEYTIAPLAKE